MKESKAVYVTKHKIRNDRNLIYQLYTKCDKDYKQGKRADQSCQFDSKRDVCTCRTPYRRAPYTRIPRQIVGNYSRSFTEIGVGSVKALQRRRVKRVYLPETDDRGVGSSDLSTFIINKKQCEKKQCLTSYYDTKKTSSKCVGGILEYNTGCVLSEKCSPIISTKSGATSPKSTVQLENNEIGSNTIDYKGITVSTQFEVILMESPTTTKKKEQASEPDGVTVEQENTQKTYKPSNLIEDKKKAMEKRMEEEKFSSDSLVQHVHDLEKPSELKPSKISLDPMENKMEREYRKIFTSKSKESKPSDDKTMPEYKSASILRRRFQALRRGLAKKEEMKKGSFGQKSSSHESTASHKDASVTSDPPSLVGRSYSSTTKKFSPILAHLEQEENTPYKTQKDSALSELDSSEGVKGMFKLWGKKFNLEEDYYGKGKATPMPSYVSRISDRTSRSSKRREKPPLNPIVNQIIIKDSSYEPSITSKKTSIEKKESKKEKRFFFFKKKKKAEQKDSSKDRYHESMSKKPENVTAGRCEVSEGFTIKVNRPKSASLKTVPSKISEETNEITKKRWLRRFLSNTIESAKSVNIRWNNAMYGTSSSTVFELIDTVYKNTELIMRSRSEVTSLESNYRSNTKNKVNFVRDIEAWMVPKTIPDRLLKEMPVRINSVKDIQRNTGLSISNDRWVIEKKSLPHKIEVVLRSKNLSSNTQVSSEYLRIDIPKDFFDSSTSEESRRRNQTSDEEVYKIVEYESDLDPKKAKMKSLQNGDVKSDIKVIVSVKDSGNLESRILETVIKRPPMHRDVIIQGSNVNIPKRIDVIGVGIITQRDLRDKRRSLIKIERDSSNDSIERTPLMQQKQCEFAESYLREYYRHWTPLGVDLLSCVSDSHLKSGSENSSSLHNQGDGSKSCPNMCDDYVIPSMLSSGNSLGSPPSLLVAQQGNSCRSCKFIPTFKKQNPIPRQGSNCQANKGSTCQANKGSKTQTNKGKNSQANKRCLPKDSLEVFKKRKLYAQSMKHTWNQPEDKPVSVPSSESKCEQDACAECPPKLEKPVRLPSKKKSSKKHVCLPDCDVLNSNLATQISDDKQGILTYKGSTCKTSSKHAVVTSDPACEIPTTPTCPNKVCAPPLTSNVPSPKKPQVYSYESPMNQNYQAIPSRESSPDSNAHLPKVEQFSRMHMSRSSQSRPRIRNLPRSNDAPHVQQLNVACPPTISPPLYPSESYTLPNDFSSRNYLLYSRPSTPRTEASQVSCCPHCYKTKPAKSKGTPPPKLPKNSSKSSNTSLAAKNSCSACCEARCPPESTSKLSADKYLSHSDGKCPPKVSAKCTSSDQGVVRKVPSLPHVPPPSSPPPPAVCPPCTPPKSPKNKKEEKKKSSKPAKSPEEDESCGCAPPPQPKSTPQAPKNDCPPPSGSPSDPSRPRPSSPKPAEPCPPDPCFPPPGSLPPPPRTPPPCSCPSSTRTPPPSICPPTSSSSAPKFMGISLKMAPSKKNTAVRKKTSNEKKEDCDPCCEVVKLNSAERITIKLKHNPSTDEIREKMNIKVTDEDGTTLYERKDYISGRQCSLLNDMYRNSNINRVSTPILVTNLSSEPDRPIMNKLHSEPSLCDSLEIQFQLRITQGDKTTEINIGKEDNEQKIQDIEAKKSGCEPKVYNIKQDTNDSVDNLKSKNDIVIKIIVKNHKAKSEKPKDKSLYEKFTKTISDKFHTVSTGYSDTYGAPPMLNEPPKLKDAPTLNDSPVTNDPPPAIQPVLVDRADYTSLFASSHEDNAEIMHVKVDQHDNLQSAANDEKVEEQIVTKPEISMSKVEQQNETKLDSLMSKVEELNLIKPFISKSKVEEQNVTKPDDLNSKIEEQNVTKPDKSKSKVEELNVTKLDNSKSKVCFPVHSPDTKMSAVIKDEESKNLEEIKVEPNKSEKTSQTKIINHFTSETQVDEKDQFSSKESTKLIEPIEIKHTVIPSEEIKVCETPSKVRSKLDKKELLKKVFQKTHDQPKSKSRVRQLRDMLKIILTDSSDSEEPKITCASNELAKDVTYTSLKPNFFRDTDSMNNYYRVESGSSRNDSFIRTDTATDSDTEENSYISIDEDLPPPKGCMCSKVVKNLNIPHIGCCCRSKAKMDEVKPRQDNEVSCNLYQELYQVQCIDAMTQNSRHSNNSMKTSAVKIDTKDNSMKTSDITIVTKDNSMKTSEPIVVTKDNVKTSEEKVTSKENSIRDEEKVNKKDETKSRLKNLFSYRNYKDCLKKEKKFTDPNDNKIVVMNHEEDRRTHKKFNAADLLQCYETKKAVLEIYAEKSYSQNGEHLVAKLPKFLEHDSEIERHFERIASKSYRSVCTKNIFYMSVGR